MRKIVFLSALIISALALALFAETLRTYNGVASYELRKGECYNFNGKQRCNYEFQIKSINWVKAQGNILKIAYSLDCSQRKSIKSIEITRDEFYDKTVFGCYDSEKEPAFTFKEYGVDIVNHQPDSGILQGNDWSKVKKECTDNDLVGTWITQGNDKSTDHLGNQFDVSYIYKLQFSEQGGMVVCKKTGRVTIFFNGNNNRDNGSSITESVVDARPEIQGSTVTLGFQEKAQFTVRFLNGQSVAQDNQYKSTLVFDLEPDKRTFTVKSQTPSGFLLPGYVFRKQ